MEIKLYEEKVAVIFMSINSPKISGINCNNRLARGECKSLVGGQWVRKKGLKFSLENWMWFCALSFMPTFTLKRNLNFSLLYWTISTTFSRKLKVLGLINFLKSYAAMASFHLPR